ncbi:formate--tetrahydrofolate ligase [Alloscardovia theropitheci]|uniref:formate--tetrahydrofolate ligase n=1 Tax=Alloscardovia theropitheci TaxID=2496842 RepID=A0A4R0QQE1_9BIFI|nr:formate--tetrahydrofolate ligase [Alloscardovia theropitheci]TCD54523.1 formate--tetrahydrofolate ligase [Alloscardovia theropitheci]
MITSELKDFTYTFGEIDKIDAIGFLSRVKQSPEQFKQGKVVLVTASTPLKASRGEGKTTTTIALIDALRRRGVDAAAVLRQPSMGITAAGSKGGASGGGKSTLSHPEIADWGLTGEMARIADAQNLLVAFCEKAVDDGILSDILIPRVSETPSRSLRSVRVDGGKLAERFVLTPASEMMQIVTLSRSVEEIAERVGNMIAGTAPETGAPVQVKDFVDVERIIRVIGNAVQPAYMESGEGSPVYIHCGPFGNVSLGIPGLTAVDMACALHDVVVVEAGYGADAGGQKWLDIASREFGAQWPAAAVVVTRATTWRDDPQLQWRYPFAVNRLEELGIASFPMINLWEGEDGEVPQLRQTAAELGFRNPIAGNLWRDGGEGLVAQLDEFIDVVNNADGSIRPDSNLSRDFMDTVTWICEKAYGVPSDRVIEKDGFAQILSEEKQRAEQVGIDFDSLAVLPVKSPATMTDNDAAPESERTVTLKKVEVHAGAGLVHVNVTTSLTTPMPKIV